MLSCIHLLELTGESFHPDEQVETISTRHEPLCCIEMSKALRIAFLVLAIAPMVSTL